MYRYNKWNRRRRVQAQSARVMSWAAFARHADAYANVSAQLADELESWVIVGGDDGGGGDGGRVGVDGDARAGAADEFPPLAPPGRQPRAGDPPLCGYAHVARRAAEAQGGGSDASPPRLVRVFWRGRRRGEPRCAAGALAETLGKVTFYVGASGEIARSDVLCVH